MAVSYREFLIELYQEYLEEASFLYEQRLKLFDDPDVSWRDLHDFEARFEPHIDGLFAGGELAVEVCVDQAENGDFGELHAAVRVFCRQHRQDLVEKVFETLDLGDDDRVQAVIDALKHELPDEWQASFIAKLADDSHDGVRIAATVIGYRRIPAGRELISALVDKSLPASSALIWAIGRIRESSVGSRLFEYLTNGDEEIRSAAALALLRIGDRQGVRECASKVVSDDWPILPLGLAGSKSTVQTLLGLGADRNGPELSIALGLLGEISAVDTLLYGLDDEGLAEYAAMGLNLITGADLFEAVFIPEEIDEDELFEEELEKVKKGEPLYLPGEAPGSTIVQLTKDPGKWRAWWRQNQSRFNSRVRYRSGKPYSPTCLLEYLQAERSPALIRKIAYEELVVRYNIDVPFETDMTVRDQLLALARMEIAIKTNASTFKEGFWYFAGRIIQ